MTQSVMAKGIDLFSNSKVSKSATEKPSSTKSDFGDVMDNSMKSKNTNISQSNSKNETITEPDRIVDVKETVVSREDTNTTDSASKVNETVDEKSTADSVNSEEVKGLQEKIDEMEKMIQSKVLSTLDISQEELDAIMETLGLTMLDLLNVDNIKQLVLQVNGSEDITAVLTNENLANSIQNLVKAINELNLGETFQISPEELTQLVNSGKAEDATEIQTEIQTKIEPERVTKTPISTEMLEKNSVLVSDTSSTMKVQDTTAVKMDNGQKEINIEILKTTGQPTDSSDSDTSTSSQNQSEVELATPVEVFVNNLAVNSNENIQSFTEQIANVRQMQEITNQIIEQIKVLIRPDQTSMELQLNPENLGKINLSVIAKDGILTAQFVTQSEIAKETIESQMQVLRDNLNNQGLKVEAIEVTVSNFAFEQSNQATTGEEQQGNSQRRNAFRDDSELFKSLTEEEDLAVNIMEQNGNSIDYTA